MTDVVGIVEQADVGFFMVRTKGKELIVIPTPSPGTVVPPPLPADATSTSRLPRPARRPDLVGPDRSYRG
jgi:hypothetical protein